MREIEESIEVQMDLKSRYHLRVPLCYTGRRGRQDSDKTSRHRRNCSDKKFISLFLTFAAFVDLFSPYGFGDILDGSDQFKPRDVYFHVG